MNQMEIRRELMDLKRRMDRVEQVLPTLLTADMFKAAIRDFATKADLEQLRAETKADLEQHRAKTKADLEALRADFVQFRTDMKADQEQLRAELKGDIEQLRTQTRADIAASHDETRRHHLVVTESIRDDIRLLAEAFASLAARLEPGLSPGS